MSIRRARVSDWQSIKLLLDQLEYPGTASFLEARIARLVEDPDEVLLVYADSGERILGFISLHFIPQIAVEGDFARISYFAVNERARGGGIGRSMEEHCTALARERGCTLIEVHCHTRRDRAHAFYFRQGYEESPKYLIKRLK
ncbi:MAG TPA: GNAT family N-acetyltransferase [Puia sp.]|nr:GNAT family N-acetyltransferase [Puia sp.]